MNELKELNLTLKKQWFDMIESGVKKEEYRDIKLFWAKRLCNWITSKLSAGYKKFDVVRFRHGYASDAPTLLIECKEIRLGTGKPEWGAKPGRYYFVIELGDILKRENIRRAE